MLATARPSCLLFVSYTVSTINDRPIISCYRHFNDSFLISALLQFLLCRLIVFYLSIQLLHCIALQVCFIKLTYLITYLLIRSVQ